MVRLNDAEALKLDSEQAREGIGFSEPNEPQPTGGAGAEKALDEDGPEHAQTIEEDPEHAARAMVAIVEMLASIGRAPGSPPAVSAQEKALLEMLALPAAQYAGPAVANTPKLSAFAFAGFAVVLVARSWRRRSAAHAQEKQQESPRPEDQGFESREEYNEANAGARRRGFAGNPP
jgi:hypothetical protein